ncbi:MAG TPA: type IV secretory system conjugative DNA transfer family protein [Alphaproteobacteria bacterium]|nr:type IV secretory system conjugative DNA transfer family protein [Alphaproteobacteria bacterium]
MNGKMFKKQKKSTAQRWSLMTVICMGLTSTIFVTASPESLAATDYPIYGEEQKIEIGREFEAESSVPKTLTQMQEIPGYIEVDGVVGLPMDIRKEALKEAALSYGARGGLAARSFEIRKELDTRADYLDKVFNFRQLLIAAPSGFMIEPPIISESLNALLIDGDGQSAAVSDAIYRIHENVKIVSSPRNWRTYLERGWGEVEEPPEILRPKNDEERMEWRNNVKIGWKEGYSQASEVFEEDLNRLASDFDGMVRYRKLLAQRMVSPPFAQQIDRGVTGEAQTMRIGDRAVVITGTPQLISGSQEWQPASR